MQTKCNRLEQELSLTLEREVSEIVNMQFNTSLCSYHRKCIAYYLADCSFVH